MLDVVCVQSFTRGSRLDKACPQPAVQEGTQVTTVELQEGTGRFLLVLLFFRMGGMWNVSILQLAHKRDKM